MSASQNVNFKWKNVPTQAISAGGVEFAYRELGTAIPGPPVVFLVHLAAVLDNWDFRVVDGFAARHHVITFDNRGIGASSGSPASAMEQMATDAITFIKAMGFEQVDLFGFSMGGMIAQEIVLMEPHLVRKMILAGTDPAGGEGISTVARVTYLDMARGLLTGQDARQFLFFTRTPGGIRAGTVEASMFRGLEEAVAFTRGDRRGARVSSVSVTARTATARRAPRFTATRVRKLREGLNLSQPVFAASLNLSPETVKGWEQGKKRPGGPAARLLEFAERHPQLLAEALVFTEVQ